MDDRARHLLAPWSFCTARSARSNMARPTSATRPRPPRRGWTLRVGKLIEAFGARPASRGTALDAFARGEHVLVFPGGELDGGKAFTTATRSSSVDGRRLARALRLDRTLRMNTLPVSVSLPWGLNAGGVGLLPHVPLPSKLRTAVLAPVQPLGVAGLRPYLLVPTRRVTSVLDPMRPGEGETPEAFGDRVEAAMQAELSAMTDHRKLLLG